MSRQKQTTVPSLPFPSNHVGGREKKLARIRFGLARLTSHKGHGCLVVHVWKRERRWKGSFFHCLLFFLSAKTKALIRQLLQLQIGEGFATGELVDKAGGLYSCGRALRPRYVLLLLSFSLCWRKKGIWVRFSVWDGIWLRGFDVMGSGCRWG